jgi:hypothetical protein
MALLEELHRNLPRGKEKTTNPLTQESQIIGGPKF